MGRMQWDLRPPPGLKKSDFEVIVTPQNLKVRRRGRKFFLEEYLRQFRLTLRFVFAHFSKSHFCQNGAHMRADTAVLKLIAARTFWDYFGVLTVEKKV